MVEVAVELMRILPSANKGVQTVITATNAAFGSRFMSIEATQKLAILICHETQYILFQAVLE